MNQHQSFLFRLPRELRDDVYVYYLREDHGYNFNSATHTLQTSNGGPIQLALRYTCKRVASEMDGLVLRANVLRFSVLPNLPETVDQCSIAASYQGLCVRRGALLMRMLAHAYPLISRETLRTLRSRYPDNVAVEKLEHRIIEDGKWYLGQGYLYYVASLDYLVHDAILQDLIQILALHEDFERLTSKEYDLLADTSAPSDIDLPTEDMDEGLSDLESEGSRPYRPSWYTRSIQSQVIEWKPAHWWTPSQKDLDDVAEFLPDAPELLTWDSSGREMKVKYYFSGAATAIRFFESLNPQQRMHLRKIVIQEDSPAVGLPETHAQGLVPFCIANPNLQIERRVDVWKTVFIPNSEEFDDDVFDIVTNIGRWINETKYLRNVGMPTASFSLVLHGPSEEASQQVCDAMIRAAIWRDGAEQRYRQRGENFGSRIALDLVDIMKAMIRGDIPARFEADMGAIWDIDKILREHEGDWPFHVKRVFSLKDFEEPEEGWEAARARYMEEFMWTDRMDGWDLMVARC